MSCQIAVIDDNETVREVTITLLRIKFPESEVRSFSSFEKATIFLEEHHEEMDVVIVDENLDGLGGKQLLKIKNQKGGNLK